MLPKSVEADIRKAMKSRLKAKGLEDRAKMLKSEANDVILPALAAHGIKKFEAEGIGRVTVMKSSGSSFVEAKLLEGMVLAGLDPDTVVKILSDSKKTWESEYIQFKAA